MKGKEMYLREQDIMGIKSGRKNLVITDSFGKNCTASAV